jgi:hypothetical protein
MNSFDEIRNFILSLSTDLAGDLIFDLHKTMKKNKPLDVWNPVPQSSPFMLGDEHKELFERARRMIEEKWQTKLEEVNDDLEFQIISELRKAYWERFRAEESYDEKEVDALLNDLRKISPYQPTPEHLRSNSADVHP